MGRDLRIGSYDPNSSDEDCSMYISELAPFVGRHNDALDEYMTGIHMSPLDTIKRLNNLQHQKLGDRQGRQGLQNNRDQDENQDSDNENLDQEMREIGGAIMLAGYLLSKCSYPLVVRYD